MTHPLQGAKRIERGKRPSITDEHGEGVAVILPLHDDEEDLHDLAVAAERRDEPAITLEEMKKRISTGGS